ncbi:MAG: LysM peptidoglycan-binding domain-containing protein, partial [Vicinamibacteria bacterium]
PRVPARAAEKGSSRVAGPVAKSESQDSSPATSPGQGDLSVEVEPGETLRLFAEWCGVSTQTIRTWNRLGSKRDLRVGQRIRLDCAHRLKQDFPRKRRAYHQSIRDQFSATYRVESTLSHTVKKNQTLWRISQDYKVPIWLVEQYNRDRDLNPLHPGDSLTIPVLASSL